MPAEDRPRYRLTVTHDSGATVVLRDPLGHVVMVTGVEDSGGVPRWSGMTVDGEPANPFTAMELKPFIVAAIREWRRR